ncbi:hypothetical protein V6N11_029136 [Hibiscus sabdariffa]
MQTMMLLKGLCRDIGSVIRRFIWGSSSDSPKIFHINWEAICQLTDRGGIGFQKVYGQNLPFIQKLGYLLITRPQALWVRLLHEKYRINEMLPNSVVRTNYSPLWRALSNTWKDIKANLAWSLVLNNQGSWDISKLSLVFMTDATRHILGIKPHDPQAGPDLCAWRWITDQGFELKSSYSTRIATCWEDSSSLWNHIWKLQVPQQIWIFLWLAGRQKLMTNLEHCKHSLMDNSNCPICHRADETTLHTIRDCDSLQQIWHRIVP